MIAQTRDRLRIVFADDETDDATTLKRLLDIRGLHVVGISHDDGAALDSIVRERPHVGTVLSEAS